MDIPTNLKFKAQIFLFIPSKTYGPNGKIYYVQLYKIIALLQARKVDFVN